MLLLSPISKMKTGTLKKKKKETLTRLLSVYGEEIKPPDLSTVCCSFLSELNDLLY